MAKKIVVDGRTNFDAPVTNNIIMPSMLLPTVVATQIALWIGYQYQMKGVATPTFWGNVPPNRWTYFLAAAGVAYALNLYLLANLSFLDLTTEITAVAIAATAVYYVLQMFFLPMVQHAVSNNGSRWPVRILLLVCAVPMLALGLIGIRHGFYASSILPFLHVLVNDALLYGFTF